MDKKDKIILQQLDVIRSMTENNMKRMNTDFWGTPLAGVTSDAPKSPASPASPAGSRPEKKTPPAATASPSGGVPAEEELPPPEKIEDLLAELDTYIGLAVVKQEVRDLINMVQVYKLRQQHGLPTTDMSLHMVFTGNPGTGKTMMARMMARIYRSLGILSKGQLVEVDRSGLVAGYVGYTDLMDKFIHSNPGLESRFNRFLLFEDYSLDELVAIFKMRCGKGYVLSPEAEPLVRDYIAEESADDGFGNARGVRNLFEHILVAQNNRLVKAENITREDLMTITADDVLHARGKLDD